MGFEGYWYSSDEPRLPKPVPFEGNWAEKEQFLSKLAIVENLARRIDYMGFSRCRICDARNGTGEFSLNNWTWPSGFLHYIKDHNVKPSQGFIEFILNYPTE